MVPAPIVDIVQDGGGPAEIRQTIFGDRPSRDVLKVFGRKDEMEMQGPVAAEHDGKAAILLCPLQVAIQVGKGRSGEIPVSVLTPGPNQVCFQLLRTLAVKFNGDDQKSGVGRPFQGPWGLVGAKASGPVTERYQQGIGEKRHRKRFQGAGRFHPDQGSRNLRKLSRQIEIGGDGNIDPPRWIEDVSEDKVS
jgi:hypothetical protein